jgi:DNA-binding CsgD family transcriptional regulator
MPVSQTDVKSSESIAAVRLRLRALGPGNSQAWVRQCDAEIQSAELQGDGDRVAELCLLAASGLEAGGRLEEALARIEFGLRATTNPAQQAQLWLMRAYIEAVAGRLTAARSSMRRAEHVHGRPLDSPARIEFATYRSIVGSIALEAPSVEAAQQAVAGAQGAGFDWLASGLVVWLVPWLAARGLAPAATSWVDWLQAESGMMQHGQRAEDAAAFGFAVASTGAAGAGRAPRLANTYAVWRVALAQLRRALLRGESLRAQRLVHTLETRVRGMNPGFRDGHGAFRALLEAAAGVDLTSVPAPRAATLVTLPAWLAGAEAAALGGTRSEAARWRALIDHSLPSWLVTSLEWPAGLPRIRALLALREGEVRTAAALFEAAVEEAARRRAPLEQALAVRQWQEVASSGLVSGGPDHSALVAAREVLGAARVPALPHAHAAARALISGASRAGDTRLTARELQVLAGLEADRSYREIAAELGVGWRTVQTHAYRIYRKLEVSGRRDAVEAARLRRLV